MIKPKPPTHDEVQAVTGAMARSPSRWVKGRTLAQLARVPGRSIRLVAQHTGQIISGQQGYCLTRRATWSEVRQSSADLESRARQLVERAQRQRAMASQSHAPKPVEQRVTEDLPL